MCTILISIAPVAKSSDQYDYETIIQDMFPKATVIGEKSNDSTAPVWPVYLLNELIGYAFESNDLMDLPGFSGERINLLTGIERLHHHEPIFLHGLGVKPFLEFCDSI